MSQPEDRLKELSYTADEQNCVAFSKRDRRRAARALDVYMLEVNGPGLCCRFDYTPNDMGELAWEHLERLRADAKGLKRSVKRFGEMVEIIARFVNRPVLRVVTHGSAKQPEAKLGGISIYSDTVESYRYTHKLFVSFRRQIRRRKVDRDRVLGIAKQLAQAINAAEWRGEECDIPVTDGFFEETRPYLETMLAAAPS